MEIKVIKRSGSKEPLNIEKIHQVLEWACEGLSDVSISDIEINSQLQFYNNIRSEDIHKVLIKSTSDLISLDHPNYQYVASRLLLFHIRKQVWQDIKPTSFYEFIKRRTQTGVYSDEVVTHYSREEISLCEAMMDHERDYSFTYAGLQQLVDKYLIKDRVSGYVHETPQFMYMLIAMVTFKRHPDKMKWVKAAYDAYSQHKINLPTPQMAGLRSPIKQYASCTLIDVGDSLDSIFASATAVGKYTAKRAGIGLNIGRIRGLGSKIRGGEVVHTGVIPYLKLLEAAAKSTTQNGIRGGGGTVYFPFWHQEVKDLIVLKNNKGNDENRVRKLDYNVQLSKLFYQRLREKKDITLFSPHDVPGLYDAFGTPEFDELYVKYEQDKKIPKTKVPAEELAKEIATERVETGRIYIMNIDHVNSHSSFNTVIKLSNLCVVGSTRLATQYGLVKAEELYKAQCSLDVTVDTRVVNDVFDFGTTIRPAIPMQLTAQQVDVYQMDLSTGHTISATEWHKFYRRVDVKRKGKKGEYTLEKVALKDLHLNDNLLLQSGEGQFGTKGYPELGLVIGFILGDGTFSAQSYSSGAVACLDLFKDDMSMSPIFETAIQCIVDRDYEDVKSEKKYATTHLRSGVKFTKSLVSCSSPIASKPYEKIRLQSGHLYRILSLKYGIEGGKAKMQVPEVIFQGTRDTVRSFLQGIFSADGTVLVNNQNTPVVELWSISKPFLQQVQMLLSNFGITGSIYSADAKVKALPNSKPIFKLFLNKHNALQFIQCIGFLSNKQPKADAVMKRFQGAIRGPNVNSFLHVGKIKSIQHIGRQDVYDTTEQSTNSLIFNGIVTGNCVEITLPTSPIENEFDNQGEIALCILAGINLSKAKLDEFPLLCEIIVRALDEIIENQEYPMVAAEKGMKARRSLGVGLMSLAHYLAKHKVKYWDKEAIAIVDRVSEHLQFHLLKASVALAKEKGACEWYNQTKYSDGLLPIDHYNKNVDKICTRPLELDWEGLREDIKLYGLRNSTLTAQMPGESSSVVVNATNGIEPPKALLSIKTSKQGLLKQIAPDHERLKDHYSLCWDAPDNIGYTNLCAVMQKYFDQSISANHYYDYSKFEEQKLPIALVLKDLIYSYTMGLKTLYYANSNDDNKQADISEESTSGCDSGACTL